MYINLYSFQTIWKDYYSSQGLPRTCRFPFQGWEDSWSRERFVRSSQWPSHWPSAVRNKHYKCSGYERQGYIESDWRQPICCEHNNNSLIYLSAYDKQVSTWKIIYIKVIHTNKYNIVRAPVILDKYWLD